MGDSGSKKLLPLEVSYVLCLDVYFSLVYKIARNFVIVKNSMRLENQVKIWGCYEQKREE